MTFQNKPVLAKCQVCEWQGHFLKAFNDKQEKECPNCHSRFVVIKCPKCNSQMGFELLLHQGIVPYCIICCYRAYNELVMGVFK